MIAAAAAGMVMLVGCGLAGGAETGKPGATATVPAVTMTAPAPTTEAGSTATPSGQGLADEGPASQSPPSLTPAPTAPPILRPGYIGPEALELQRQLSAAGYWVGVPDGTYGLVTQQAVLALQKAAGLQRDGLAGAATQRALTAGVRPAARSHSGRVLEVDTSRQLVLVVKDGKVEEIFNTSTGTNAWYSVNGVRHLADTPKGTWKILRQVNGVDHGTLGDLYRPKYFHTDGIAFHGYPQVPAYPASHGCVRLTNAAMDWMWSSGVAQIGTTVLVY